MNLVRIPAVSGLFYPKDPSELTHQIHNYLKQVVNIPIDNAHETPPKPKQTGNVNTDIQAPKALIVPHAGYDYSGAVAACAYATLLTHADTIKRVFLLGPAHRVYLKGMAVSPAQYFQTPLGDIPIDTVAVQQLLKSPQIQEMEQAHRQEHSLEVQLPFLQSVLDNFTLIPIVIGDTAETQVCEILNRAWGGNETLIVISSDLSHFEDYNRAKVIDKQTCSAIEELDYVSIKPTQACGSTGIKGLLMAAKAHKLKVHTLALANSGDTSGDRQRVVGYGTWVFTK